MGQAKLRGSFEQRKAAAVELARVRDEADRQLRLKRRLRRKQELREADEHRAKLLAANPGTASSRPHARVMNKHSLMLAALALGGAFAPMLDHPERDK